MHRVEIEMAEPKESHQEGDLYLDPNTGCVYMLRSSSHGPDIKWYTYNLSGFGCYRNGFSKEKAVGNLQKLPSRTVITLTVDGED